MYGGVPPNNETVAVASPSQVPGQEALFDEIIDVHERNRDGSTLSVRRHMHKLKPKPQFLRNDIQNLIKILEKKNELNALGLISEDLSNLKVNINTSDIESRNYDLLKLVQE